MYFFLVCSPEKGDSEILTLDMVAGKCNEKHNGAAASFFMIPRKLEGGDQISGKLDPKTWTW